MNPEEVTGPAPSLRLPGCPNSALTFIGSQLLFVHGHEVQVIQVVLVAVVQGGGISPVGHVCMGRQRIGAPPSPRRRVTK